MRDLSLILMERFSQEGIHAVHLFDNFWEIDLLANLKSILATILNAVVDMNCFS